MRYDLLHDEGPQPGAGRIPRAPYFFDAKLSGRPPFLALSILPGMIRPRGQEHGPFPLLMIKLLPGYQKESGEEGLWPLVQFKILPNLNKPWWD